MGCVKSKGKLPTIQPTIRSKDGRKWDAINVQLTQNVLLIWLDANIDQNSNICQNNITHFRDVVNNINTFTDIDECIQFLQEMTNEKICMIISGSFAQQIIPRVHNLLQLDSMFIFCHNKEHHERSIKDWSKVKGVFNKTESLCEALKQVAQQCEQNAVSITIVGDKDTTAENRLDPSFMYTQLMKEILLTINFDEHHLNEFIQHCRKVLAGNDKQLKCVDEIAHKYHQHTAIWWYTRDSFLYAMVNRALRVMDVDLMIKVGFFIGDLHRHIEELHQQQFVSHGFNQPLIIYRGQAMEKKIFEKMLASQGGLMSFNSFLSTSNDRATSLEFARRALKDVQMIGVLFVMLVDPTRSDTPFASVGDVGYFGAKEDEILFSMHTIFRIVEIIPLDDNPRLVQVKLTLASDRDNDLHQLIDYIREQTFTKEKGWSRLGWALWKIGEYAKAQHVYEVLLGTKTEKIEKAPIYNNLGLLKYEQGEYAEAITYNQKSIEIEEKLMPRRNENLWKLYNNIGLVYSSMSDYATALSFYEKTLHLQQKSPSPVDPDVAISYNNIGGVYFSMGDYQRALASYEKAFTIQQQALPSIHPDLAMSHNNIGEVYRHMSDSTKALSAYEKALTIRQQSLPPTHPDLAACYNNIGLVYSNMGDHKKALSSHEHALFIRQQSFPPSHPYLADSHGNIGLVYHTLGDYSRALSSYERALSIQEESLPSTHPDLATSYNNIGEVYRHMGDSTKALSAYERALTIRRQSLPPSHPDLAASCNNIGIIYSNIGDHTKALQSHEHALLIRQQSYPPTHPHIASSHGNIGLVYHSMGDYRRALSSYEQALSIQEESLPPTHLDLASCYNNIGLAYSHMGDLPKGLSFHEKALEIRQNSLPSTHPDLALSYSNIGIVHAHMGEYPKALSSYEALLTIQQQSLPATHPDLAISHNNIGLIYSSMHNYSKAYSSHETALIIQTQALSDAHPGLAATYCYLGSLQEKTRHYWKAYLYYDQAVKLAQHSSLVNEHNLQTWRYDLARLKLML